MINLQKKKKKKQKSWVNMNKRMQKKKLSKGLARKVVKKIKIIELLY
jgi:hypothetical protein